MDIEVRGKELIITVDSSIYNIDVLHKCFYWYGGMSNVDIKKEKDCFLISLTPKSDQGIEQDVNAISEKIRRDLIDFKLRDIVTKETQSIRELIVAKAFAYYGLDEDPSSDVSDPVGFVPETIKT
jgi:His-Xaa-Ser system protein HxsD